MKNCSSKWIVYSDNNKLMNQKIDHINCYIYQKQQLLAQKPSKHVYVKLLFAIKEKCIAIGFLFKAIVLQET